MGKDQFKKAKESKAVDYYAVEPDGVPGSVYEPQENAEIPKVFQPLKVKRVTFPNRAWLSPMCTYSGNDKFEVTPFHLVHYGAIATRGAGLTIVEATSVSDNGGLSPHDLGIWNDEQAKKLKDIVDYAHANRSLIGIQLAHGGRKASGLPLWLHLEEIADKSVGGWPENVVAPSAIQYRPNGNYLEPKELTKAQIKQIIKEFGEAAKRAVEIAGFDVIEIHGAHGYLITSFLSATSNKRTDEYGGSFDNRIRFLLEVIELVKANVPKDFPLLLRISGSENAEDDPESWTIQDSQKLAKIVVSHGIDIIDVSSGGNNYKQHARGPKTAVHKDLAKAVKEAVGDSAVVATVGALSSVTESEKLIEEGYFDVALNGRAFLKNPGLVLSWADELGVRVNGISQYDWPFHPKKEGIAELIERQDK